MFTIKSKNYWMKSSEILIEEEKKKKESNFKEDLYLFLNTTICHCYRHLAQVDRSYYERCMWIAIHIFNAFSLWYLITTSYNSFVSNPLVTTLHDTIYPVKFIPFPSVSFCTNNRISKSQAEKFARELSLNDPEKRDVEYFLKQILFLGRIYDFETENEHLMTAFQQFIDEIAVAPKNESLNSNSSMISLTFNELIRTLTPTCEDLMIKCIFKSKPYNPCMQKYHMIEQRQTAYGYCCSFNFQIPKDSNPLNRPYYSDVTGKDMGLIVLVNQSTKNYFYNMFNNVGINVLIHGSDEFPDPLSGSASERFVRPGEEMFIRVDASNIHAQNDILSYTPEKRQCLFPNELQQFGHSYTRSQCFLTCKIRSIQALCDCLPFNLPAPSTNDKEDLKICTLQHVPCLNKYKVKWLTIMSDIISIKGLEREMEESLLCRECYPSCHDNKYRLTTSSLPLVVNNRTGFGITNGIGFWDIGQVSLIRVFFGQRESFQYYTDVSMLWYELFSNLGGLFGVVGGFSLIGLTETIYFIIKQIILFILRKLNFKIRTKELIIYP